MKDEVGRLIISGLAGWFSLLTLWGAYDGNMITAVVSAIFMSFTITMVAAWTWYRPLKKGGDDG